MLNFAVTKQFNIVSNSIAKIDFITPVAMVLTTSLYDVLFFNQNNAPCKTDVINPLPANTIDTFLSTADREYMRCLTRVTKHFHFSLSVFFCQWGKKYSGPLFIIQARFQTFYLLLLLLLGYIYFKAIKSFRKRCACIKLVQGTWPPTPKSGSIDIALTAIRCVVKSKIQ